MKYCCMLLPMVLLAGCAPSGPQPVTVYVALDELYSKPILDEFTRETGIPVRAVYDTEASKTTGLVNRILAERERPQCDVFWNNETAQTIVLQNNAALTPYRSPAAEAIPEKYKDAEHYWTGFAARMRVIIYNTDRIKAPPTSIRDLLDPKWKGKAAIALPLFGTTATHAAALYAAWGEAEADAFFQGLKDNEVAILPGNATVRDLVCAGEYDWGLTDTDDANGAMEDGKPAQWLAPDQNGLGTLVIPNTVALVKDGPNPGGGKALIDYLLSPEIEERLARMRSIQMPLNPAVELPPNVPEAAKIHTMDVTFDAIAEHMQSTAKKMQERFVAAE